MGNVPSRHRSEIQAVETTLALVLGIVAAGLLTAGGWLAGVLLDLEGAGWSAARDVGLVAALFVGSGVTVWWLLRARRRGL